MTTKPCEKCGAPSYAAWCEDCYQDAAEAYDLAMATRSFEPDDRPHPADWDKAESKAADWEGE